MSEEKREHIRFTLEMDNLRSVIDSTMPRDVVKQFIVSEIEQRFSGPVKEVGESRFVEGPNKWHLEGRYLIEENTS